MRYIYKGSLIVFKEPVTDVEDYHCNPKEYTGAAPKGGVPIIKMEI